MPSTEIFIHFESLAIGLSQLFDLADKIQLGLADKNIGQYEGHSFSPDYKKVMLALTSENADALIDTIKPILKETDYIKSSFAEIKYLDNRIIRIDI
ncbi:MAG: hypothetical protein SFY56_14230 [Bacteroidota bacterium]|nr:hypothetical protein [Bacteroidota bacterium]